MDLLWGVGFLYAATRFIRHYKKPYESSREDIKMMAILIMGYCTIYGGYNIWTGFGGAPFTGF